jgi:hypothetical protein
VLVVFIDIVAVAFLIVPRSKATRSLSRVPMAIATLLLLAGLLFPPGDLHWERGQDFWFGIGGVSWCLLAMTLTLVYTGLGYARKLEASPVRLERARRNEVDGVPPAVSRVGGGSNGQ